MKKYSEWDLIQDIKKWIPRKGQGLLGIGDDADLLAGAVQGPVVVCCDAIVDGVDFLSRKHSPELIGRKALAINLSDLTAMGARPLGWLLTLGLPEIPDPKWLQKMFSGITKLAGQYTMQCLGGDLTKSKDIFLSVTVLGTPFKKRVITRSGAKPGDAILVTGKLGGSLAGHHLTFQPRILESEFLVKSFHPTAMIDISDGSVQDLGHILEASGVGARLHLDSVPVSLAARKLSRNDSDAALRAALTDGEDFELIITLPERETVKALKVWKKKFPKTPLTLIGQVQKEKKLEFWMANRRSFWDLKSLRGYTHFEAL